MSRRCRCSANAPEGGLVLQGFVLAAVIGCCAVLLPGRPAWATIDNLKSYRAAYPGKEPKAYSCKVCHNGAIGKKGDLNSYGLALQQHKGEGNAKQLTEADLRAVEQDDADKDGASNLDEINAGTAPGDPASTPTPKGKASSSPAPQTKGPQAGLTPSADEAKSQQAAKETPAPSEKSTAAPAKAEYVGSETCEGCHTKEAQEFKKSTHARLMIPSEDIKAQGCESCHGPGSLHVEAGGGRGVGGIINPRKDPSTCFACHTDKKMEFRQTFHHPVLEGKMSCADCHNPHGEDVRPWSATTQQDINEACYKCHKDQRGPFVWEHEALREGCVTCHKVHGSINDKMLIVRDSNLCLRCHTQVLFPVIGKSSHSSRLSQGTCFSAACHTAVHGSNFDAHLRY